MAQAGTGISWSVARGAAVGLALVTMGASASLARAVDFSGTWQLDTSQSRVHAEAGLAGLIAAGAPTTLHVTHPANGTLVVESQINESHARIYLPGAESSTPIFLGGAGRITMTSRWEGETLISEGTRESAASPPVVIEVKEVMGLRAEGRELAIEITTTARNGKSTSRLVYTRLRDVGPCESWPTPCKTR